MSTKMPPPAAAHTTPPQQFIPQSITATALKFALGYAVVSTLWLLFSSAIIGTIDTDPATRRLLEEGNDWLFILVTSCCIFYSIYRALRTVRALSTTIGQQSVQYQG